MLDATAYLAIPIWGQHLLHPTLTLFYSILHPTSLAPPDVHVSYLVFLLARPLFATRPVRFLKVSHPRVLTAHPMDRFTQPRLLT